MGLNSSKLARPRMEGWGGVHIQETFVLYLRGWVRGEGLEDRKHVKRRTNNSLFSMVQPGWRDRLLGCGQAWAHHHHPPTLALPGPKMSKCQKASSSSPSLWAVAQGIDRVRDRTQRTPGTAPGSANDTPVPVPHPHQACWLLASCSAGQAGDGRKMVRGWTLLHGAAWRAG